MTTCICGIPHTGPHCPHCDVARTCPPNCPACTIRDAICPVCRTPQGTPIASKRHEEKCRATEAANERGPR